jgi:hypothetical protein
MFLPCSISRMSQTFQQRTGCPLQAPGAAPPTARTQEWTTNKAASNRISPERWLGRWNKEAAVASPTPDDRPQDEGSQGWQQVINRRRRSWYEGTLFGLHPKLPLLRIPGSHVLRMRNSTRGRRMRRTLRLERSCRSPLDDTVTGTSRKYAPTPKRAELYATFKYFQPPSMGNMS